MSAEPYLAGMIERLDLIILRPAKEDAAKTERHLAHSILAQLRHLVRLSITDDAGLLDSFLKGQTTPFFPSLVDASVALSTHEVAHLLTHAPAIKRLRLSEPARNLFNVEPPTWPPRAIETLHTDTSVSFRGIDFEPVVESFSKTVRNLHVSGSDMRLLAMLPGVVETLSLGPIGRRAHHSFYANKVGPVERFERIHHLQMDWGSDYFALNFLDGASALQSFHLLAIPDAWPQCVLCNVMSRGSWPVMKSILLTIKDGPLPGRRWSAHEAATFRSSLAALQNLCDDLEIRFTLIDLRRRGQAYLQNLLPALTLSDRDLY
jgi:hypothetical protein